MHGKARQVREIKHTNSTQIHVYFPVHRLYLLIVRVIRIIALSGGVMVLLLPYWASSISDARTLSRFVILIIRLTGSINEGNI